MQPYSNFWHEPGGNVDLKCGAGEKNLFQTICVTDFNLNYFFRRYIIKLEIEDRWLW